MSRSVLFFLISFLCQSILAQSPHGTDFNINCATCHHPENWSYQQNKSTFSHDSTSFPLIGQHRDLDCRSCHQTLEFKKAESTCISCHTDVHQQTVGNDCARCHTPQSWIVENITQLHEQTSFPLMGVHATIDCNACHQSESNSRYSPTGVTCIDCHRSDYVNTQKPNHIKNNFGNDCAACHGINGSGWNTDIVDHSFFPLEQGHQISDCKVCHLADDYSIISPNCISCHQQDYDNTLVPSHKNAGFSTQCTDCHTLAVGWKPVNFAEHDGRFFPIYSGKHKGVWTDCNECHTNTNDFSAFTCITCHINPETDNIHDGISGYQYQDNACLACHPTGDADMAFNHDNTQFPLTGAHRTVDCISCHATGYQGTSTACMDCHTSDFNAAINPNHTQLGLSKDCASCHTTQPGWSPATFADHNTYYALNGAHALISNDCAKCHNGDYNNTPNTCFGCHNSDYNEAQMPDHKLNNFDTDCTSCHSENAWSPSTFNHDGLYFPIFSGKHNGQWSACLDCHTVAGDFKQFSCITCHTNPETNDVHGGVSGYSYENNACLACHPTGDADNVFDHNTTMFPLTGAHLSTDCIQCHASGFQNTPTTCVSCHNNDFLSSTNPNHAQLNLTTDCIQCHTTQPGWSPATFTIHNTFYPLNGAHPAIATECISCHNGDYNNTPNTCVGCHNAEYTATTDPNHITAQFPTDCASCHSENAWSPSTFNHDGQYFPIYSGKHRGEWTQCIDCHNNPSDYSQFTCITCHQNPETNDDHNGVPGYIYNSQACFACHPTGDASFVFDHNTTAFPLTGAHVTADCTQCHASGFQGTSTLCMDCHTQDFNQATNPNHVALGIPTDCIQCHTTQPGWSPATFANHDNYYVIQGAHLSIANNCAICHNGNYNNTPNTCIGCHTADFNSTTNPDHEAGMFPTDCATCHSQTAWTPSIFDHAVFWPLTGAHAAIAANCVDCHNGNYNNTSSECASCHQSDFDGTTNPNHSSLGFTTNCTSCHTTDPGWSPATMPNHDSYYVIAGAHLAIANNCVTCHNGDYNNTPNTCVGCHQSDFASTTDPNHIAQQFPNDCVSCHSQDAWTPSTFDHNTVYPLIGAHATIANNCIACHSNGNYTTTPTTCVGCHQSDFNATTNPNHVTSGYPTDCTICHSQNAWSPTTFDHNTVWPLTGGHAIIANQCASCHNGNYTNTPTTCVACHQGDYNTSINPNHGALALSTECTTCHTTAPGWSPASMPNHNDFYVIAGAHIPIANNCVACHNGNYNNTPNTCFGCHATDYNTAVNPNHSVNQFPTDCASCHSQNAWAPSSFNHNNYYPLTGAHASIAGDCVICHNGNYTTTPNTCVGCHQSDYNGAINPNHSSLGLSNDCITCHTTAPNWTPALFPNHNNYYVLAGAHIPLDCISCHNGNYNNTPNTCVGCHQSDYNGTTNPNHGAAQFPTDCTTCHSQNAWTPSTFNHDNMYFPIYSGKHNGEWNLCADCHFNSSNYNLFSCINCHEHNNQAQVNDDHDGVNGYQYNSNACYACHPDGED